MYRDILRLITLLLITTITLSCSSQNEIERTAQKFLTGYFSMDFKEIKDISMPTTLKKIEDIESRIDESFDRSQIQRVDFVIHEHYEEGDTAYCRYTLRTSDSDHTALSEQLLLIKKEGKWLVEF